MFLFNKTASINGADLERLLREKPIIIDVRETEEFISGHIPGARHLPLSKIHSYKGKPDEVVYLVCQSGMRSKQAATTLKAAGYQGINVKGGMNLWQGPVKGGRN